MDLKIKVCGMREPENIREISGIEPDYMGFIFYPGSKRYTGNLSPAELKDFPDGIKKVAVFVNAAREEILNICLTYSIQIIQLHGEESPEFCRSFLDDGFQVIKAFRIGQILDMDEMERYTETCNFILLDTSWEGFGGTGRKFDWEQLREYRVKLPFFLSGGIAPDDAARIKEMDHPQLYAVDLNSQFEIVPGLKNLNELDTFIRKLRS